MDRFDYCMTVLLENEGGYVDDKLDPGGETKYGISKRSYPREDIKNLSKVRAGEIYKKDYWLPIKANRLPKGVDLCVFDMAVNAGINRASRILQECIFTPVDGVIGEKTIIASQAEVRADLIKNYTNRRISFYKSLMSYDRFGDGWVKRAIKVEKKALDE